MGKTSDTISAEYIYSAFVTVRAIHRYISEQFLREFPERYQDLIARLPPELEFDIWSRSSRIPEEKKHVALTIGREDAEEQDRIPDKQYAMCPHRQRTYLEEDGISLLW